MIVGRIKTGLHLIQYCSNPHIRHPLFSVIRFLSAGPRRPQNEEIPYRSVRLVDPDTGHLNPPALLKSVLQAVASKTHFLELVSENPEPIVRVICRKDRHEKLKEIKQKRKDSKREDKEIQLTWGVAAGDLQHKLKKVRQELQKGNRVSLVFAPKKGQSPLSAAQMASKVQETVDSLADVGKEWKLRDVQKATTAIHFQGINTGISASSES